MYLDSGTSGARRPNETTINPESMPDLGADLSRNVDEDRLMISEMPDDSLSIQPGQRERQSLGLLDSENGSDRQSILCSSEDGRPDFSKHFN